MSLHAGTRIGHYDIAAKLGEGGMGEVYRARDTRLGRDVALKVLPDSFAADPERIARFEREAQILATLSHANIAAIHGLEIAGPTRVLVMQLVEGESLEARLRRGPLPVDDVVAVARQIGEALSAAHERGIVHRDLKPGNIMLTPDGSVKVLDFGLARMIEPDAAASGLSMSPTLSLQATMAGTILGTAPYMSPEQARGRTVDKRTDIWAFGCVLFEMLTGKRAFDGEDVTGTVASILKDDPDWAALPAGTPPNVVAAMRGCLAKNATERLADIAVPLYLLTTRVDPAQDLSPAIAPAVPTWKRAMPMTMAAIVSMLFTGGAAWLLRPTTPAARTIRFSFQLPDQQAFTSLGRKIIALSPDGSSVVYVANQQMFLRSFAEPEPRPLPGIEGFKGTLTALAFSPDGRQLAFYSGLDRTLRRIDAGGGTATTICEATNPTGLSWEPAGLLFGQTGKGIFRVPPTGGAPQQVVRVAADEIPATPQSLPDNRGILFSLRKGLAGDASWDSGNVVVELPSGERKVLVSGASDGRYDGAGHLLYSVSGVVMAVGFDLRRLEVTGTAVPAIEGVMHQLIGNVSGSTQYDIASNGTLAFAPGPVKATQDAGLTLATFDAQGNVEPLDIPLANYRSPRVSPDGRMVAFELGGDTDTNVWIQDLTSKTASRRLTFGGENRAPVWSADGEWIAFQSDREGDAGIFRQRANGNGVAERLTKPDMGALHWPQSWSPDGATLLFSVEKDKTFELRLLSLKDRTTRPFSDVKSAVPLESGFSPDGRWIVYQRNDKPEVLGVTSYLEPFPPTGAKFLIPVGGQIGGHPYWSRKGDRLYFNTTSSSSAVVEVHTTPTVSFGKPQPFPRVGRTEPNPATSRRGVDTMPDGRVLGIGLPSITRRIGAGQDQITIILNWQQALNAKLGH